MDRKLVAVALGAAGYGALVGWAFTADHKDNVLRYHQSLFSELLQHKNAEIRMHMDLAQQRARMVEPHQWESPLAEDVQKAAESAKTDILDLDPDEEQARIDGWVESQVEASQEEGVGTEYPAEYEEDVIPEGETPEETRTNLQNLIAQYTSNPDDIEVFSASAQKQIETAANEVAPFVISRDLYAHDPDEGDGYSKITLTYYEKDRVLLDDDEDPIDVADYIGWQCLRQFGGESMDMDVVFVRNRRLLTDFEVVRITDEDPPLHVRYGMSREEFNTNKAAGVIKFRDDDGD